MKEDIKQHLKKIYKNFNTKKLETITEEINSLVEDWKQKIKIKKYKPLTQEDVYLIAYGDSITSHSMVPLQAMYKFMENKIGSHLINNIHFLPFFPYSSDDGFSVKDYYAIDSALGEWKDVDELSKKYDLMFDMVINHISSFSSWVLHYLKGNPDFKDFFVEKNNKWNYSKVVRPRTSPLFHKYKKEDGSFVELQTTFSQDQIDLNFRNPEVLKKSIDILLHYISHGAKSIRLDAIGFLWKENNSSSIHLPETHEIIKLWRTISNYISEDIILITETNVPSEENISYFGEGDEANMVYQFPLPILVLNSFLSGDATKLSNWAKSLDFLKDKKSNTFFNFLASHDGIAVRPSEGILTNKEVDDIAKIVLEKGGKISYRTLNGKEKPYEFNINYYSVLKDSDSLSEINIRKFIASISILLSFIGVPAIYYHSLLGSENDYKGYEESGINRRINREKLDIEEIFKDLKDTSLERTQIFNKILSLINIRKDYDAFHPYETLQIIQDLGKKELFSLKREGNETNIFFVVNVSDKEVSFINPVEGVCIEDGTKYHEGKEITLKPYEFLWLKYSIFIKI